MSIKVRKTLTLDPEVVETFGADSATLSATVNAVLRAEMERRSRRAATASFLAELEEQFGPPDAGEVARVRELFS